MVSGGDFVVSIPTTGDVKKIDPANRPNGTTIGSLSASINPYDAVVFDRYVWIIASKNSNYGAIRAFPLDT